MVDWCSLSRAQSISLSLKGLSLMNGQWDFISSLPLNSLQTLHPENMNTPCQMMQEFCQQVF